MSDYQSQLEKLGKDAAECALIRDLATDPEMRKMFDRIAHHLGALADQVESEILTASRPDSANEVEAFAGRHFFLPPVLLVG